MATLKQINQALADANCAERLARGDGYFYFHGGSAPNWTRTCVWVARLKDLSIKGWVAQRHSLSATLGTFPVPNDK